MILDPFSATSVSGSLLDNHQENIFQQQKQSAMHHAYAFAQQQAMQRQYNQCLNAQADAYTMAPAKALPAPKTIESSCKEVVNPVDWGGEPGNFGMD